jgi:hypothetical protein
MLTRARIRGLERRAGFGGECDGRRPTFTWFWRDGAPEAPLPPEDELPKCPRCGWPHVLELHEVVVTSREEAQEAMRRLKAEGDV